MSAIIGNPLRNIDFENIFKPYADKPGLLKDDEQVRRPDSDSVDIDGRSVDPGKTAKNNLLAVCSTVKQAVPVNAAKGFVDGVKSGNLPSVVFNTIEGLALDAANLAKAPIAIVKDSVEAVAWGATAGIEKLTGKTVNTQPKVPATQAPDVEDVSLRTKETGRSGYFQYALKDGKIWTKWDPVLPDKPFDFALGEPITKEQAAGMLEEAKGPYDYTYNAESNSITCSPKANASEIGYKMENGELVEADIKEASKWHLHDQNGGPRLPDGEKIVAIQVAGDFVEALSDKNVMYRYDPTKKDCSWKKEWGCPFKGDVNLPEGMRDWTLGEATTVKPKRNCLKSMNPYTDIVGYYEDINGRKGDFNFVATTGIITPNGREIRYRDTGLVADFSRGFLTPCKGEFEADKLAAAGSTWFVEGTDPDGKPALYTRMYDYEINGACPGQRYTYDDEAPFDPDKNYSFADNKFLMPVPGWSKVEFPALEGKAVVTDHIDILPTGQGNDNRELRIAGKDAQGVTGFYSKALDEKSWQFTATNQPLEGKEIQVGVVDPKRVSAGPITQDFPEATWGKELEDAPISNIELNDFHPFQTPSEPSTVVFTLKTGQQVKVNVATVDGYSFYRNRPQDDNVVGEGVGVPKVLTGTLLIPDEVKNSSDPEVKAFVEKYLEPLDRKENQLMLQADGGNVRLTSSWYHRNSDKGFDWTKNPKYDITFSRDAVGQTAYEVQAKDNKLMAAPHMTREELEDVIVRNEALKDDMKAEMKDRKRSYKLRWARAQASEMCLKALSFGICALNLTETVNHGAAVTQLMPPLLDAHEKANFNTAFRTPEGFTRAQEAIDQNIAKAQDMLKNTGIAQ